MNKPSLFGPYPILQEQVKQLPAGSLPTGDKTITDWIEYHEKDGFELLAILPGFNIMMQSKIQVGQRQGYQIAAAYLVMRKL